MSASRSRVSGAALSGTPSRLVCWQYAQQAVPHAVAADAAAGAVLQLQVRAGRLPAVVLAADQANAGTRTLSKNTVFFCTGSVPPSPPVPSSSIGDTVMPGRLASIMNQERFSWRLPPGLVHAIIQMRSAPWSLPTKIFCPLTT